MNDLVTNDERVTRKSYFNMVEVMLALGVIAIGCVSIMSLFPVGTNASRDAIGETYSSQMADMFLNTLEREVRNDWSSGSFTNDIKVPNTKPYATSNFSWTGSPESWNPAWSEANMYYKVPGSAGDPRLYRITSTTAAVDVVDFDGIMRIWTDKVDIGGSQVSKDIAIGINCEISWPAAAPYNNDNRKKAYYRLELFNR